jgi:hypothetical protein
MISREQLRRILEQTDFTEQQNLKIKLERALHLAITENEAPDAKARDAVAYWKERIENASDVTKLASEFLDRSASIPFIDQKIIQWLVASAYSRGFKSGQRSTTTRADPAA